MDIDKIGLRYAAAARARKIFEVMPDDFVICLGVTPIRHIVTEGRDEALWATLDPWCIGPSTYAGPIDSMEDLAETKFKPAGDLRPIQVSAWYPEFMRQTLEKLRKMEAA
jgi:hypothetical protein